MSNVEMLAWSGDEEEEGMRSEWVGYCRGGRREFVYRFVYRRCSGAFEEEVRRKSSRGELLTDEATSIVQANEGKIPTTVWYSTWVFYLGLPRFQPAWENFV